MRHFEIVVLGSDVAGLVAGALLAKGGRTVLHLDPASARSAYRFRDLTFHRHLRLFSSWDSSPAQKRTFFDLNLISDMSRRLVPLDPSFQVVFPEHRIDVWRSETELAQELEREFPGSGPYTADALREIEALNERLDRLLDGSLILPPQKWRERRELSRTLAEHPLPEGTDLFDGAPADHPLRRLPELPLRFFTQLDPDAANVVRLARAARKLCKGFYELPGGLDELKDTLSNVIRHFHGDARDTRILEVAQRWGRVTAFHLDGGEVVGCDQVIAATPVGRLLQDFPSLRRDWGSEAERLRPTHRVYTLNVALRPGGVPEGMGPLGFLVRDPAAPLVEENLLLWSLHAQPGELRPLTLACLVAADKARDPAFLRAFRRRVLEALGEPMPFLSRHVAHVDVPWEDGEATGENARPVDEMDEIYAWEGESTLGISALPLRTPLKNVVLANRQILPALGLEGEFLAGACAARLLRGPKERKGWFEV